MSAPETFQKKNRRKRYTACGGVVGDCGFEPQKSVTTDLQSAPFGRSGNLPGAGGRNRTPDLLITSQLLYLLSYTSTKHSVVSSRPATFSVYHYKQSMSTPICKFFKIFCSTTGFTSDISRKIIVFGLQYGQRQNPDYVTCSEYRTIKPAAP